MIELDTGAIFVAVIITVIVGFFSGALGTYVAIKVFTNEIKWINKMLDKHDKELDRLHDRFSGHLNKFHTGANNDPG